MNRLKEFFTVIRQDPKAKELMKSVGEPKSAEEAEEQYAAIAEKLGYDLSVEEIRHVLQAMESSQKARTGSAEDAVKASLDENDLNAVAGGGGPEFSDCEMTHHPGEWCWMTDSCSMIINFYEGLPDDVDVVTCMNNTTTYHLKAKEDYEDWDTWYNVCPGNALPEPAPKEDPWKDY